MKKFHGAALLISMMLFICSCGERTNNKVADIPNIKCSSVIGITINDYYVEVNPNLEDQWIEPMSMKGDANNTIAFGEFEGWNVKLDGNEIQSGSSAEVRPDNGFLQKYSGIEMVFTNLQSGAVHTQHIRYLNQGFPEMITYNNGADDGFYYFEPTIDWICKMDTKGNIIYYKYIEEHAYDFHREILADGTFYYCYRQTTPSTQGSRYLYATSARAFAKEVIMDKNYNVVKEVQGLINRDGTQGLPLDNHDFIMIGLNHYICMTYVPKYVDNIPDSVESNRTYQSRVLAAVIQEVKDNNIVFEWDSTEHPELYNLSLEGNVFANNTKESQWADYMHCNSMDLDPKDNNLLVSFRNLNAIVKIDRNSGDILWILGGKGDMFGLPDEQKFNRQHFARYTKDGSITLFDNSTNYSTGGGVYYGNGTGVPRGLEFYIDEKNHKVTAWKSYDYGMPQAEIMGSAQKLGEDKMLLGWGWSLEVPSYAMFSEIDTASHTTLFECSSDIQQNMTYRVYKDIQ